MRRLRRADPRNSIEPLRSANRTVTCLRSPSRAALEVRIFSARCFGVYASGPANLAVGLVRSGAAHWPQNLFSGGLAVPQDGQVAASGAAHSPQNFMPGGFSCWHRGHCTPRPPNKPDRDRSDRLDEGSLSTDRGQGLRAHTIGRPKVYYRAELTERILRGAERDPHLHPSASQEAREASDGNHPRDTGRARLAPHWIPRRGGIRLRRSRRNGSIRRSVTAAEAAGRAGVNPAEARGIEAAQRRLTELRRADARIARN